MRDDGSDPRSAVVDDLGVDDLGIDAPGAEASYTGAPRIVGVHVGAGHDFSKSARAAIRLVAGFGVEGDAHAGAFDRHLYHVKRFGSVPNLRQVHLIQAELFDDLAGRGHRVRPGDLGENIATRGVDLLGLPTGTRLRLGPEAVVELTGLRNPCRQIDAFQPGLLRHLVAAGPAGPVRRAGVMGVVRHGGSVQPGDPLGIALPEGPHTPLVYRVPGV